MSSGAPVPGAPDDVPPEPLDLPLDSHLHTELSPDSEVPVDAYAALAVERGIAELAITDHLDFEPGTPAYGYVDFARRERYVRDAAERWADRVAIRFGCELTYARRHEDDIRRHLRSHRYDFTIGSVHVYAGSPYRAERIAGWVSGRRLREILEPYFSEVEAAARSGLFDTLGHLDFVKRYVHPHVLPAEFAKALELYEPILRALIESGTGLEVNTSGLRQAPRETYPSAAVVDLFRRLGGERVSAGSDAHEERSFAYGLEDGYRVVVGAGFTELAFRRGGDPVAVALPVRLRT